VSQALTFPPLISSRLQLPPLFPQHPLLPLELVAVQDRHRLLRRALLQAMLDEQHQLRVSVVRRTQGLAQLRHEDSCVRVRGAAADGLLPQWGL